MTGLRSHAAAPRTHAPPVVHDALRSPGRPLEPSVREEMEARFGHDFSSVRVHTDGRAAESAAAVSARAYTVGRHVVFGGGAYRPSTSDGRRLVAHELTHVVQQGGGEHAGQLPVAPAGGTLEAAAASAGRSVASGRAVTHPLGSSGLALARQIIGNENQWVPDALQDEAKKKEFEELWQRLKQWRRVVRPVDYPERKQDVVRLLILKAEATALASGRERPIREREAAVKEAEEVLASTDADEEVEEAEAAVLKIAERATDPMFAPGGFTDEMIYGEYEAAKERLDKELAPAKDPRRFKDRFKEAKKKAPIGALLKEDYYKDVWEYGLREGLFAEREHNIVFDELRAPARERAKQERRQAEIRQYNEQIQRFRSFRSQLNLGFIQGALLGRPGVPMFIRGPYISYGVAQSGVDLYRGIQSGDPTKIVGATLPLAAGVAFHRIAGVGEPVVPGRPGGTGLPTVAQRVLGGRGKPVEIFDYDVRTAYNANPASVKKIMSNSWAQYVWEMHGGEGIHPMAWRHHGSRVVYVNEARWTGRLSEINEPHQLIAPGQGSVPRPRVDPLAQAPTLPDPRAATQLPPPAPEPPGPGTQPSAPPARPMAPPVRPVQPAPAPGPSRHGRPHAVAAGEGEAVAAYQANPGSVYGSPTSDWHMQIWYMNRGQGAGVPVIYRSGNVYLVDVERAPAGLLAQLGMGMRLP